MSYAPRSCPLIDTSTIGIREDTLHLCLSELTRTLQAAAFPNVPIYGGSNKVPALTVLVKHNDAFSVGDSINVS